MHHPTFRFVTRGIHVQVLPSYIWGWQETTHPHSALTQPSELQALHSCCLPLHSHTADICHCSFVGKTGGYKRCTTVHECPRVVRPPAGCDQACLPQPSQRSSHTAPSPSPHPQVRSWFPPGRSTMDIPGTPNLLTS